MSFARSALILILTTCLSWAAWAQLTGKVSIVLADGTRQEIVLDEDMDPVEMIRGFINGEQGGTFTVTDLVDGKSAVVFFMKKENGLISFEEGGQTVTVEEALAQLEVARAQGQLTACKSNLKNLATALEMWSMDHEGVYPDTFNKLAPEYLIKLPKCPTSETGEYGQSYKTHPEIDYSFSCPGDHSELGLPKGYPAYNGQQGLIESP